MRRTEESGAVVPLVAVMLTVLVTVTALTVDLGRQRVARTDMQSVADVVALDLARELDGRTASAISPTLQAAADRSLARNPDASGDGVSVVPQLGTLAADGTFTAVSGATVPTAVKVVASTSVGYFFRAGSGGAHRSAVGVARATACYKLGSWAARLSTTTDANVLYQALAAHGVGASVGAATYQSLAGAHVDVGALSTALGLASPEALGTTSVSLSTLLTAVAQVVGTNGSSSGQVSALNTVRAGLGALATKPVALGSLLSVATGAGSGLSAAVNLADLVAGAVLVADGNTAVSVPGLTTGVPGLASATSSLTLIQAAKAACGFAGSTPNTSNQVALTTTATLAGGQTVLTSLVNTITGLVGIQVNPLAGNQVTLSLSSATATSTLDAVSCNAGTRSATVGTSGGLISGTLTIPVSVKVTTLTAPLGTTVTATITVTLSSSASAATVSIAVPSQSYDTPYSNGGTAAQLPTATTRTVVNAGGLTAAQVTDVLNAVTSTVVNPLVTSLNSTVVGPLSDLTGLRTAGADVLLLDHPSCTAPSLRG
ncbi:pilus assembly protein TadG-related protein [Nocardioides sp.]|uniref:pilus assembly protein TadG-related protein n=1 Tax=Nocardioides sp. TaxID=35761 RepID=UPI0037831481